MKSILKSEEVAMTAIGIYGLYLYNLNLPFWLWFILFFSPDVGMLGYLVDTKIGAFTYNVFHHKGIAIVLATLGWFFSNDVLITIGIILFAHASFDRVWGYGLKYADSFKNTHLGWLEKNS